MSQYTVAEAANITVKSFPNWEHYNLTSETVGIEAAQGVIDNPPPSKISAEVFREYRKFLLTDGSTIGKIVEHTSSSEPVLEFDADHPDDVEWFFPRTETLGVPDNVATHAEWVQNRLKG